MMLHAVLTLALNGAAVNGDSKAGVEEEVSPEFLKVLSKIPSEVQPKFFLRKVQGSQHITFQLDKYMKFCAFGVRPKDNDVQSGQGAMNGALVVKLEGFGTGTTFHKLGVGKMGEADVNIGNDFQAEAERKNGHFRITLKLDQAAITKFGSDKMLHLVWACVKKDSYHGNHRELMQLTLPEEPSMQQEIKGKKSEGLMVGADCKDNVNGCKRGLKCRKLGDEVHESWKCTPKPKNALTSGGPLSKENALTSGGPLSFVLDAPRRFLNLVLGAPGRLLDFFLSSMKIIWTTIWTTLFATVPTVTATAVEEAANAVEEAATAVAATAVEEVEYEDGPSMDEKTEKVKKVNVEMKVGESEDKNNRLAKNLPPTSEPKRFINLYGNKV